MTDDGAIPFATRRNLYVSLVVLAAMAGFLIWSYQYDPRSRLVPVVVGWAGLVLCALDVIAHLDNRVGRWVGMVLSGTAHGEASADDDKRRFGPEAIACLWMVGATAGVVLFGFMLAVPVYVFAYMLLHGGRTVRQSGIAAVVTTLFIWLVFEVFLRYEVYRGVLFED
jgi:hypothetical protein